MTTPTSHRPRAVERGVCGFRLTYLPDFLLDHTLLGADAAGRIGEFLNRWAQFVAGLWVDPNLDATYGIRFRFDNEAGATDVAFTVNAPVGSVLDALSANMRAALAAFGLPVVPWPAAGQDLSAAVASAFPPGGGLTEVRQAEQAVDVLSGLEKASSYLVSPFVRPVGTFLLPFEALAAQTAPVLVAFTLRPRTLTPAERNHLREQANQGRVNARRGAEDIYGQPEFDAADVMSEWQSEAASAAARRLMTGLPFLVVGHAASPDPAAARAVGFALAAGINEAAGDGSAADPAAAAQAIEVPADEHEHLRAALREGRFAGAEYAADPRVLGDGRGEATHRLRYLTDARGAAALFRLPVGVRGGVAGIPVRQAAPDFDPGPRPRWTKPRPDDGVPKKDRRLAVGYLGGNRGVVSVRLNDLTKHALITGFTGGGKSNTVRFLLDQLWKDHRIPFLVLESAKNEYRGFLGDPGFAGKAGEGEQPGEKRLRIYTLGNERCAPFRLNPFELQQGVRLEAHLSRLAACFAAALPNDGPMPSLVGDALELVYLARGWRLTDAGGDPGTAGLRPPVMRDFERTLRRLLDKEGPDNPRGRGYVGETLQNLRGYIASRVSPLVTGSKGMMFGAERSTPPGELFDRPVILEMNDLNLTDKAVVTMFLMTLLREYRELNPGDGLAHVTVVEEAHNLLEKVGPAGEGRANSRHEAVQAFCNMLAEVRSLGEGLVIADQSPGRLAPDAMRNTNLQIAHQLRDGDDRAAVARAMIMSDEQRDYIGKLGPGLAAVFHTELDRATFAKVPRYDDVNSNDDPDPDGLSGRGCEYRGGTKVELFNGNVGNARVREYMLPYTGDVMGGPFGPGCGPCAARVECPYRDKLLAASQKGPEPAGTIEKMAAAARAEWARVKADDAQAVDRYLGWLADLANAYAKRAGHLYETPATWCATLHLAGPAADLPSFDYAAAHARLAARIEAYHRQNTPKE
jgi:hypothetical protein